ncbi:MAG: DNA-directed DNA polymerase II small subunit [archaeon]
MQNLVKTLLKKGILINPEEISLDQIDSIITQDNPPLVLDKNSMYVKETDTKEYDKNKTASQKPPAPNSSKVEIITTYEEFNIKKTLKDFVDLYNHRYQLLQSILRQRQDMSRVTSIIKLKSIDERETVSVIAIVLDIRISKNNNVLLKLEDPTGIIKAIITKNNKEAFELAKEITPDEVIGVSGTKGNNVIFVNNILNPDVPIGKELKKSPIDEAAVFIGDLHFGSKAFLKDAFERFMSWILQKSKDTSLSKKVKYLFIMGDLVEGIGIFPGQEKDLETLDIYEQYNLFTENILRIPEDINIIICPGNHDSIRIAEPQPPIPKEMFPGLQNRKNLYLVSSPSNIRIGANEEFHGIDILLYHGFSFPYYANAIESLRLAGGLEATDKIMAYLLKKRHLAPTHGSTQYQLGFKEDPLVIKTVPDIFVSGHIHRATIANYRNTTLINSSCWVSQTDYQEQRGLMPDPCKAVYIDLKTRDVKMLDFEK